MVKKLEKKKRIGKKNKLSRRLRDREANLPDWITGPKEKDRFSFRKFMEIRKSKVAWLQNRVLGRKNPMKLTQKEIARKIYKKWPEIKKETKIGKFIVTRTPKGFMISPNISLSGWDSFHINDIVVYPEKKDLIYFRRAAKGVGKKKLVSNIGGPSYYNPGGILTLGIGHVIGTPKELCLFSLQHHYFISKIEKDGGLSRRLHNKYAKARIIAFRKFLKIAEELGETAVIRKSDLINPKIIFEAIKNICKKENKPITEEENTIFIS